MVAPFAPRRKALQEKLPDHSKKNLYDHKNKLMGKFDA